MASKRSSSHKWVSSSEAMEHIQNGQTILIGSGCAEPLVLTEELKRKASSYWDLRIIHLIAQRESPLSSPKFRHHFRFSTFYGGRGLERAVMEGSADLIPMNISQLPNAMLSGIIPVDIALIQVSPPNSEGNCSLGISVDILKAGIQCANLVIAQVNPFMPISHGDTVISLNQLDYLVQGEGPLLESPPLEPGPVALTIGRHISAHIPDRATLHLDGSRISAAITRHLSSKKDLGIHTEFLTDEIFRLIQTGVVTNQFKNINKDKTIVTAVMGSKELYQWINQNPEVEIHPVNYVNNPQVISSHRSMISIHAVDRIELSGTTWIDFYHSQSSNRMPSSMDFLNGSSRSHQGLTIIALQSTTSDGKESNIVLEAPRRGVSFSPAKIDLVVTEYGSVSLYGLSYRERAIALISIAHPKFRLMLREEAVEAGFLPKLPDNLPQTEAALTYPHHFETTKTFKGGEEVFFRPIKPTDVGRMQRMFYSLSKEIIHMRYHGAIKTLSEPTAILLCNIDYTKDMAIVGLVGPPENPSIIAEGRYTYDPSNGMGEFDILVSESYQRKGIGIFLAQYLNKIAYTSGLKGIYAEVIPHHGGAMGLLSRAWPKAQKQYEAGTCRFFLPFPIQDVNRPKASILIHSGRFSEYTHPLPHFNTQQAQMTFELIKKHGYMDEPWMRIEEPRPIEVKQLYQSSSPTFVDQLQQHNIPLSTTLSGPGLFDFILLYTSSTLTAADFIVRKGANLVFNPMGGFHQSSREKAKDFCYINDVILVIDYLLAQGYRVAYINLGALHGEGVQQAFYSDDRVLVLSLHQQEESNSSKGKKEKTGKGSGLGFNINIPLPPNTDDEAFQWICSQLMVPAVKTFTPTVIVCTLGADAHKNDPTSELNLTNNGMVQALKEIRNLSHRLLLLGGRGYNHDSTAKSWCRIWAAANRLDSLPDYLLTIGGTFIGEEDIEKVALVDRPFRFSGALKTSIIDGLTKIHKFHQRRSLPHLRRRRIKR